MPSSAWHYVTPRKSSPTSGNTPDRVQATSLLAHRRVSRWATGSLGEKPTSLHVHRTTCGGARVRFMITERPRRSTRGLGAVRKVQAPSIPAISAASRRSVVSSPRSKASHVGRGSAIVSSPEDPPQRSPRLTAPHQDQQACEDHDTQTPGELSRPKLASSHSPQRSRSSASPVRRPSVRILKGERPPRLSLVWRGDLPSELGEVVREVVCPECRHPHVDTAPVLPRREALALQHPCPALPHPVTDVLGQL
jgi:hypothetical protein